MPVCLLFYSYFHYCVSLIVHSHKQTHVQNVKMARNDEADKMIVFGRLLFIPTKTKLFIFTRYQSIKIDTILRRNLNLVRALLFLCPCKLSV